MLQSVTPFNYTGSVYTAEQTRQLDGIAINQYSTPGIVLMKRAGRAALDVALNLFSAPRLITVYCGSGNNAGDGYVVAALAKQKGLPVQVIMVGDKDKLTGDAKKAFAFAEQADVEMQPFDASDLPEEGIVIDALLGTGFSGQLRSPYDAAIQQINATGLPVIAVDIPSGLNANTGAIAEQAVHASTTVTFIGVKRGLLTGAAPAVTGELYFDDLDVPADVYKLVSSAGTFLNLREALAALKPRAPDAHKGSFGHVLVIGGDEGMGGAALMAAESAARTGAGLVSVATHPAHAASFMVRRPELMVRGITSSDMDTLSAMIARATVLVVGPGLGQSPWSERMFDGVMGSPLPKVLDADALNRMATLSSKEFAALNLANTVITPHPGEAARLLQVSTSDINEDRFAAIASLQQKIGGTAVLKGAGTLIGSNDRISVARVGNPGMASGGMGDVLSGVIGGLLAQGLDISSAAELGVLVHGIAADRAVKNNGTRGLLATDLLPHIRNLLNGKV